MRIWPYIGAQARQAAIRPDGRVAGKVIGMSQIEELIEERNIEERLDARRS